MGDQGVGADFLGLRGRVAHFDEQDRSLKESLISWMKVHNKDKSLIMMIHSLSMAKWGGSIRESHGYGDAALQEVHGLQATIFNCQILQLQIIQMRPSSSPQGI